MKKKIVALALVVAVAAMLAAGLTLAYFTDTAEAENVMVMGKVDIALNEKQRDANGIFEDFVNDKMLLPAVGSAVLDGDVYHADLKNVIDKFVSVTNNGNTGAYVRVALAFEQGSLELTKFLDLIKLNTNTTAWTWTQPVEIVVGGEDYVMYVATHTAEVAKNTTTADCLRQFYLAPAATQEDAAAIDGNDDGKYEILVMAQAVQADGFSDAATALDAAFGALSAAAHPFAVTVTP